MSQYRIIKTETQNHRLTANKQTTIALLNTIVERVMETTTQLRKTTLSQTRKQKVKNTCHNNNRVEEVLTQSIMISAFGAFFGFGKLRFAHSKH